MDERLRIALEKIAATYGAPKEVVELSYPEEAFGDYTTNLALKLARETEKSPHTIAEEISAQLKSLFTDIIKNITPAGPGFINIRVTDEQLIKYMVFNPSKPLTGQTIIAEYGDPNPFKLLHAGHLYTAIVGDSIANLLSWAGAKVFRVNYGGDIGLHVAKTMWAILERLGGALPDRLDVVEKDKRSVWLSSAYVEGNNAYEDNETAKSAIMLLNEQLYAIQSTDDHHSDLAQIYWATRDWSYSAFEQFYKKVHIIFDRVYAESSISAAGKQIVEEQLAKGIFTKSDGAIVFIGEQYGLHTRVFVNSKGLPTYEAKELGLAKQKAKDFAYDRSIIITGSEQEQYMAVVYRALSLFEPKLASSTTSLTHGMVRLAGGKKMSSRKGNVLTAAHVLEAAEQAASEHTDNHDWQVVLAAVKYSMLKQRLGGDIIYNPKESVAIVGNSGPYLQYAHARARSILAKIEFKAKDTNINLQLNNLERSLALKLSRANQEFEEAARALSPHLLCNYLYELAQIFNRFYEVNKVIGGDRQSLRVLLVEHYATILKQGLELLGIAAPEKL